MLLDITSNTKRRLFFFSLPYSLNRNLLIQTILCSHIQQQRKKRNMKRERESEQVEAIDDQQTKKAKYIEIPNEMNPSRKIGVNLCQFVSICVNLCLHGTNGTSFKPFCANLCLGRFGAPTFLFKFVPFDAILCHIQPSEILRQKMAQKA